MSTHERPDRPGKKAQVRAASPAVRVPMEGAPRRYITHAATTTVTMSTYYRRRIKDGDLVVEPVAPNKKGGEK